MDEYVYILISYLAIRNTYMFILYFHTYLHTQETIRYRNCAEFLSKRIQCVKRYTDILL